MRAGRYSLNQQHTFFKCSIKRYITFIIHLRFITSVADAIIAPQCTADNPNGKRISLIIFTETLLTEKVYNGNLYFSLQT